MMSFLKRPSLLIAPGTLFVLGLLTTLPFWNAKGDDAFITFEFVKNLVNHHQLAFNLGEPVYGFTSPLWLGVLAAFYSIIPDMYSAVWVASFFSLAFLVIALWLLSSEIIENKVFRYLAIVAILVDPWLMRWAFSGQEITFKIAAAAIVIAALGRFLRERDASTKEAVFLGLLVGLGCLTRPEFLLFLPIAWVFLVTQRRYRALLALTLAFLVLYGAWAFFCYQHFGYALPHTILVKTGSWRPIPMSEKMTALLHEVAPRFIEIVLLPALGLLGVTAFVLARYRANRVQLKDATTTIVAVLWITGCIVGYTLTTARMMSMYTLLFSPFIPLVAFALLDGAQFKSPRLAGRLAWLSLCVGIAYSIGVVVLRLGSFSWLVSPQFSRGEDERHIELAEWVRDNLPKDARVATRELGVVGYFGERYTIDLAGIATPKLLTGDHADHAAKLHDLQPTHFWLYEEWLIGKKAGVVVNREGVIEYEGFMLQPIRSVQIDRIGGSSARVQCVIYAVINSPDINPAGPAMETGTKDAPQHLSQ